MADRTSAEIFDMLAEKPTEEHKQMAKKIWPYTFDYDFNHHQMSADNSLFALGLAKKGINPEYPEDGETILYMNSSLDKFEN